MSLELDFKPQEEAEAQALPAPLGQPEPPALQALPESLDPPGPRGQQELPAELLEFQVPPGQQVQQDPPALQGPLALQDPPALRDLQALPELWVPPDLQGVVAAPRLVSEILPRDPLPERPQETSTSSTRVRSHS